MHTSTGLVSSFDDGEKGRGLVLAELAVSSKLQRVVVQIQ